MRCHLTFCIRMVIVKKNTRDKKHLWRCVEKGILVHVGVNVNYSSHYKIGTPYDPAIPLPVYIQRKWSQFVEETCTPMFTHHYLVFPLMDTNNCMAIVKWSPISRKWWVLSIIFLLNIVSLYNLICNNGCV
jgi:hypothetical protein